MPRITYTGPRTDRIKSTLSLYGISLATLARHALGRRLDPTWPLAHEIGIRFWRAQFTTALTAPDIKAGRTRFDSLQTRTDTILPVTRQRQSSPNPGPVPSPGPNPAPGTWVTPKHQTSNATLLYFHGGGYTFDAYMTDDFADLLAASTGARLFQADYRLTPEHPHPAQAEDALAAYRYALTQTDPSRLIVLGDSAGGHMALMALLSARDAGLPQPALCIGLSPWTDIGDRGDSLTANDPYDIVSGWMALKFGDFLTMGRVAELRDTLSPIAHDFSDLAPLYLQGGGKEVLIDMIRDFARTQADHGARLCLDVWPNMTHDFFGYGDTRPEAIEALARISEAIEKALTGACVAPGPMTETHAP